MAVIDIPTRTSADPNSSSDINTLNNNDQDLDGRVTTLENASGDNDADMGLYRNAIINPIDAGMIDQYGKSGDAVTIDEYFIDRWKTITTGVGSITFTKNPDTIQLSTTSSGNGTMNFLQPIEDVNYSRFVGKEVTYSAYVNSDNVNCRLVAQAENGVFQSNETTAKHSGGGGYELLFITFTMPANPNQLSLYIGIQDASRNNVSIATNDYFAFQHAQFTRSDAVLPYQPNDYGVELIKSQRYYQIMGFNDNDIISYGNATSGTLYCLLPSNNQMIKNGVTLSVKTGALQAYDGNGNTESVTIDATQGNDSFGIGWVDSSISTISNGISTVVKASGVTVIIADGEI